jgi:hypothetical protein
MKTLFSRIAALFSHPEEKIRVAVFFSNRDEFFNFADCLGKRAVVNRESLSVETKDVSYRGFYNNDHARGFKPHSTIALSSWSQIDPFRSRPLPDTTIRISAFDAKSFMDRRAEIVQALCREVKKTGNEDLTMGCVKIP